MWSDWLVFCDCGFHFVCPLMKKYKRLMEATWWERLGLVLMGRAMFSKSSIQFSVYRWSCVPSLVFTWGQTMVEVEKIMVTFFHASTGNSWIFTGKSGSVSCGITAPFSWVLVGTRFCLCPSRVHFPVLFWQLSVQFQFSRLVMSDYLQPHESQHTRPPCSSPLLEFIQTHVH